MPSRIIAAAGVGGAPVGSMAAADGVGGGLGVGAGLVGADALRVFAQNVPV